MTKDIYSPAPIHPKQQKREGELGAACEKILKPISQHFLELGVGIAQFLHIAKVTYVQAAAEAIKGAGQRPTVSRVAAITGLQRKEVSQLLALESSFESFSVREPPTMRVVAAWRAQPEFTDRDGKPRMLPIEGAASFRELVENFAGDVTHVALLRELERLTWVRRTSSGLIALNATPADFRKKHKQTETLALRLADFASAIVATEKSVELARYTSFRESQPTNRKVGAALSRTFSRRAEEFLDGFERWAARSAKQAGPVGSDPTRFGIGIYFVEKRGATKGGIDSLPKRPRATRRAKRA